MKKSVYFRAAVFGLVLGMALGLSGCGDGQPEVVVDESENLEEGGLYIEDGKELSGTEEVTGEVTDVDEDLQKPQVEEPLDPPTIMDGGSDVAPHIYTHMGMFDSVFEETGVPNLLYSPLSLDYVVGMLAEGATDEARQYVSEYLRQDVSLFTEQASDYMSGLPDTVRISNALFVDSKNDLNSDTVSVLEDSYQAGIKALDFGSSDAISIVDAWCEEHTEGLVTHLFDDMSDMDAAVVNALYFHQDWEEPVEDSAVQLGEFHNADGTVSSVDMMYFDGDGYITTRCGRAFVKNYEGGRYSFIGLLPNEEGDFTFRGVDMYAAVPGNATGKSVVVTMPEFTFENQLVLDQTLQGNFANLGILYDRNAFPGFLADGTPMGVTTVLQNTKIVVDRKGTEAAAVTGGAMDAMSVLPEEPEVIVLDRPFGFMIYDNEQHLPLFLGKVTGL